MINFLNKCIELAPQATTALLNEKNGAIDRELRENHGIVAVKNAVGKVTGFSELKAGKKAAPKSETKEDKPKAETAKKTSILGKKKDS